MAIVVEDGTGLIDAVSYVSLAEALAYHTQCGNTKWTDNSITDADRETALVRATNYIDKRFGLRFIGYKSFVTQSLEWPRYNAYDKDGFLISARVPLALKRATYEYGIRALLLNVLAPDPTPGVPSQNMTINSSSGTSRASGELVEETVKIGPVEVSQRYHAESNNSLTISKSGMVEGWKLPEYPEADLWIEQLIGPRRHELARS